MYLAEVALTNFRKFGADGDAPALRLNLRPGVNLLVGENDSGKSCLVDAIHYVLFDESHGWLRVAEDDFHREATVLSIECLFRNIADAEAKNLIEWLSFDENGRYYLKVMLRAYKRDKGVFVETRAGTDSEGSPLSREARQYLCATYLKPLRDAEHELAPGRRSRLARILESHPELAPEPGATHPLVEQVAATNAFIRTFFTDKEQKGGQVYDRLSSNLSNLSRQDANLAPAIDLDTPDIRRILEKLALTFADASLHPGLGAQNLLFMAAEFLLLKLENEYLKLALIEEIEAHLDSLAQTRVMEFFEQEAREAQLIITTHSPGLASTADLNGLILFRNGKAFPLGEEHTGLDKSDYAFLRRFLDATKANLFFATGVIIVEGSAEAILLPTLTKALTGHTLAKVGVSIVNVGSTALLRYARIFHRSNGDDIGIPVSCITDRDIPPKVASTEGLVRSDRPTEDDYTAEEIAALIAERTNPLTSNAVAAFVSPAWTLEYDLATGTLGADIHAAVALAARAKSTGSMLTHEDTETVEAAARKEYAGLAEEGRPQETACKVYRRLANGSVSKVAAAEYLANILEGQIATDRAAVKARLEADAPFKYLRDAILHATRGAAIGG